MSSFPQVRPKICGQFTSGEVLGHYRVHEKIGEGGMGEVYRARDEHLDSDVAIKVLPPECVRDESARQRFRQEAHALARLNHPNIAVIHDFDSERGVDYLVMEYIPGINLSARLIAGKLREEEVVRLGTQLADGLCAAHAHGVIHTDLKPDNLRLTEEGWLKILDFGLAKLRVPVAGNGTTESLTETRSVAGTLAYMSPEQARGESVDARTDLFSFGAVLYEMATGKAAFVGASAAAVLAALLTQAPRSPSSLNPDLSPALERIIDKALEKNRDLRYQSAAEMRSDLNRLKRDWESGQSGAVVTYPATTCDSSLQIQSIAVLPLTNLSGDAEQEYFADGMTEELITKLAKIHALKVISRTSAMHYKQPSKPMTQIGRELGVDAVVEGSVLRSGRRVRITAQLIHAATDKHLWAESYVRDVEDVLALQDEIARAIVEQIKITVTPQEKKRLAGAQAVIPDAYEAFLKGRHYWSVFPSGLEPAIDCYGEATRIDPKYAPAYAGLAMCYSILGFFQAPRTILAKARAAALKALELEETLAEAHTGDGMVRLHFDWDWPGVDRAWRRALELNPHDSDALRLATDYLLFMGQFDAGIAKARLARNLDPLSQPVNMRLGYAYMKARRYEEAIEQYRRVLDLDPYQFAARQHLAWIYTFREMYHEALAQFEQMQGHAEDAKFGSVFSSRLGFLYASMGRLEEARGVAETLKKRSPQHYVDPYGVAIVYAGLGDHDQTIAWLEKGWQERSCFMPQLKVEPFFDCMRADSRFQEMLERMNFPA